ncbi:MAG: alpha/beta hydrolase [Chloroflexi bacterium]|nr:alpha/beta hydrolase [Chloroflexota bacterium]
MATYVLIHGASSDSWYWHRVVPELRRLGHDVVAPDLPSDDAAGLAEYADTVVDAIDDRRNLILVAQFMAGFTAPIVCERVPVYLLIMVAAMVPRPSESPGEWWDNTGYTQARRENDARLGLLPDGEFDPLTIFFHDVPEEVTVEAVARGERRQSDTPFLKPWPLDAWPDVPTEFLLCRDDRLFPAAFMRRVVTERLGITPDEMESGHLPALAHPSELVERLEQYRTAHLGRARG